MYTLRLSLFYILTLLSIGGCQTPKEQTQEDTTAKHRDSTKAVTQKMHLELVASSDKQWTGVAVSQSGRIFVNYPRWSDKVTTSVAEIVEGEAVPYPNEDFNAYRYLESDSTFIAVQSVYIDDKDRLWVLDPANPLFEGVVSRGPKLYQFDLEKNALNKIYSFPGEMIEKNAYLNDVRVDTEKEMAYITDSERGALLVLNLNTGEASKRLAQHPSARADSKSLEFSGKTWKNEVHSDGIALSPDKKYIYYAALTGHTLYRIPTEVLNNFTLSEKEVESKVEKIATIEATDGMLLDAAGNLYLGGLEKDAVYRMDADGNYEVLVQEEQIRWADSFAKDKEGAIYFSTSQIHLDEKDRKQYQIFKIIQ